MSEKQLFYNEYDLVKDKYLGTLRVCFAICSDENQYGKTIIILRKWVKGDDCFSPTYNTLVIGLQDAINIKETIEKICEEEE